jgi:hypothetical protein
MIIKYTKHLIYLILLSLSISPSFALGEDNRNLLLIGIMGSIAPIIIIVFPKLYKGDRKLLLFMLLIIMIPLLFNPQSMRWSTVLYSIMFCLLFLAYKRLLYRNVFTLNLYLNFLKKIIYAYTIVLIIQQLCVLIGFPIFNISNYDPSTPWKLNSLSAEPSHSARIIGLLMYCYISMTELQNGFSYNLKNQSYKDKKIWLAFLWSMLTMGSSTAILFLGIISLKLTHLKNRKPVILTGLILFGVLNYFELSSLNRILNIFDATLFLNPVDMLVADHSASMRIVPIIILATMVSTSTIDGWFGHGIDYVSGFLSDLIPGVPEGFSGGGLFQLWMEYGFLIFIIFLVIIIQAGFNRKEPLSLLFLFMLVFLYGVNNQMVWLCIVLLFTNKFFFNLKTKYGNS